MIDKDSWHEAVHPFDVGSTVKGTCKQRGTGQIDHNLSQRAISNKIFIFQPSACARLKILTDTCLS